MVRALPKSAGGLLSYFTRHKTLANLLLILMLVAGAAAIPNIRAQSLPDVIVDDVRVNVTWDDAGPEDIDAGVVQVLEPSLLAVEGVSETFSLSREGRANITLEFEPDWDMSRALEDVKSAVDSVTNLPEDIDEPTVRLGAWGDRVTDVVISGPVDAAQLGLFADEFVTRLFVEGVTRTTIRGVAAPQTMVEVPQIKLLEYDITMAEIARAIEAEVDTDPAGEIDSANARIRTGAAKREPVAIAGIVLRSNPDGSKLTISDVATVTREGVDRARQYFVGEHPAMSIRVDRSDRGDAIAVQRSVEKVAAELQATLPPDVTVQLIRTRAEAITSRLNILIDNGLVGLGLVVMLLFLFLNARTAFWVAAGIPVAMCAALAFMYLGGLTINMVSLFGLIITLGIVVDDAIVVGEHADYRYRTYGEPPAVAAENAARRMAMPVFAATLTTVIAFFGLMAIGGRFGQLIADIPFTVIAVLLASLAECFLILPHHMSHALAYKQRFWDILDTPSRYVNRGFEWVREVIFRRVMALVIRGRYVVLAGVIVVLASQVALFITRDVQWRFFNAPERNSVSGNFAMTEGATRDQSVEMMRELQRAAEELGAEYEAEHGRNPIDFVIAEVGGSAGRGLSGTETKSKDLLGAISIELIDADLRPYSSYAFVGDLQDRVARHPMLETISFRGWRGGPGGDALDVQFFGADTETLKAAAEDLKRAVAQYPEVSAVEDNLAYDKEEMILNLTGQGQVLGFKIDEVGRVLRNRLGGIEAATYPEGTRSATIRVELPAGELTADFLETTQMRMPSGEYVPLADIVSVERKTGFSTVRRENGIRLISVTGDISEDDPARATEIQQALEEEILPGIASERQVEWRLAGLSEQEDRFLNEATTGLILCLTGIYLVLSWVFASWTRPFVVMAIIPFGLIGTIYGHYVWEVPLSMFTVVGLLGMTGIIINDSIVLVTTIDEYAQDRGLVPSIIDGTADRLRPVMLTTLTTVLGLVPLLYEGSAQAEFLKPTIITLVYGLGFGVFVVLLVVPALIAVQHDMARQFTATRRALRAPVPAVRLGYAALVFVMFGWFMVTLGPALWPALSAIVPMALAEGNVRQGFAFFLSGSAVLALVAYCVAGAVLALRGRNEKEA